MDQERTNRMKAKNAKHRPWDRWTAEEKAMHLNLQGGARPIKWTLDPSLAGQVTEDGYVWAYAGGPAEGTPEASVKRRADGKVDGRSKGVRKCGKCGQPGHNARTCGRRSKGPAKLPASLRKPVTDPVKTPSGTAPEPQSAPEVPKSVSERPMVQTPSGKAPKPRSSAALAESRAASKGARKCGKCGKTGHNARTCGKGPKVKRSKAPGRQKTCGKCGQKGHNRRTCTA